MSQDTDTTRIVDTVEDAESTTSAEFVVAIEPSSRSYRDVDLLFAIGLSLTVCLFWSRASCTGLVSAQPQHSICGEMGVERN